MKFGTLNFAVAADAPDLMAAPTKDLIESAALSEVYAAEIDPTLSDTAAFCDHYQIGMEVSANCVIVEAKRADKVWYAACIILATTRADINGVVRKYLNARKISFAPMDTATTLTAMEFGGINPIGLPDGWPILVDGAVANTERVIIGSGKRKSKLLVRGELLANIPNATVLDIAKPT
ncbi:MAG: hypothetical protein JWN01_359 [Patescibacteria group bacterium]|nr:hypothetical protein [Patescibacteria group bacterium]